MKKVLVTGAGGYIGSHLCSVLFNSGLYHVTALDLNFDRNEVSAHEKVVDDVRMFTADEDYDAVVHLAGLISVEESNSEPLSYYDVNMNGTINMLAQTKGTHFIFASTAGAFDPISPYAKSKVAAEDIIRQVCSSYTIFRFFNVAGSDGIHHQIGKATHLIRIASEVATGKRQMMQVFGTDYDTRDGSCVRDYIHVLDLVNTIAATIEAGPQCTPYECLGTGVGSTTLEVIETMRKVTGKQLWATQAPRRPGDPATLALDGKYHLMQTKYTLEDICLSAYEIEGKLI